MHQLMGEDLLPGHRVKIVALVPSHDEEETIGQAIQRLADQSVKVDIVVICDNCKDETESVARSLQGRYPQLQVMATKDNETKKAGALNQALEIIVKESKYEFVLVQDADTILDPKLAEEGIAVLENNPKLAAVCSRAGVLDPEPGKFNWWNLFIWRLQKFEYSTFDASRVETLGHIKVIHGMAAVYRLSAMIKVAEYRAKRWGRRTIYDETNIIEDFELTLCFKESGFNVTASMDMLAWTSVPMTLKELFKQRLRWIGGSIDALRQHGLNRVTFSEYWQHLQFTVLTIVSWLIVAYLAIMIYFYGDKLTFNWLTFGVIGYYTLFNIYRLRYVQRLDVIDVIMVLIYLPNSLYHLLHQYELARAYWLTLTSAKKGW